ncbi:hypothetical protein B0T25DRAFT_27231 [Lasiosphaeria hispida]|uniref:Secreted protein n=1 Tax=Lasiosphaeria hispida TaxID=260671 RepID=A0AAJ0HU89_9PEZI|nr:hypothetical protein B0T25DRAFT_27231 [Lasiosphaeria hispida]
MLFCSSLSGLLLTLTLPGSGVEMKQAQQPPLPSRFGVSSRNPFRGLFLSPSSSFVGRGTSTHAHDDPPHPLPHTPSLDPSRTAFVPA